MYHIVRSKKFEKSLSRLKHSGVLKVQAKENLTEALRFLASGERLPISYRDHQLAGTLSGYRECHIKGNLLLVYRIFDTELVLILVDIGTHSYLGL